MYMDLESHDGTSHKTWAENEVMEPFEYHLGFRGKRPRKDPFFPASQSNLLLSEEWFAAKIPADSFQSIFSVLSQALVATDYKITELEDGVSVFECTVGNRRRQVSKRYQKVW